VLPATFRAIKKANPGIPSKISVLAAVNAYEAMLKHMGGPHATHEVDGKPIPVDVHFLNHLVEEARARD
jgi:hypothetical protein